MGSLMAKSYTLIAEFRENGIPRQYHHAHFTSVPKAWNRLFKRKSHLLAEAESLNHGFVALGIVLFEVVEQAATLADQHEKTAARTVVLLVRFEVIRQLANTLAQQRDLDFGAARISGVGAVLVDEGFLLLSG
jgi:hypothetical protein